MKPLKIFTAAAAIAAVAAAPAATMASSQAGSHRPSGVPFSATSNPGQDRKSDSTSTPGPQATPPAKAKAYGVYCSKESKQHVSGQQGTPFSQCVTAMAKLASSQTSNPARACAKESKKHVLAQHGTPFSQCVSAAAKLKASTTDG